VPWEACGARGMKCFAFCHWNDLSLVADPVYDDEHIQVVSIGNKCFTDECPIQYEISFLTRTTEPVEAPY